jgi:hypothetical protein
MRLPRWAVAASAEALRATMRERGEQARQPALTVLIHYGAESWLKIPAKPLI